jgi:glucose/arabinose dehydrogenase
MKYCLSFLFFLSVVLFNCQGQVVSLSTFSSGYTSPVDIVNCGDSRLFIVQQNGYIYICDSMGVKQTTPFLNISTVIAAGGERGLLGLAFHPDYAQNGYFYLNYTASGGGATKIARYSVDPGNPNVALANSGTVLLTIAQPYANHNGGCLRFGPDGYLYIGTGDGGSGGDPQNHAQTTTDLLGKMLRIDVNNGAPYGIPTSNPFVGNPNYAPEIWAVGVRNPWRFSFDRLTDDLWIGDVGQNQWEEIDFQPAGDPGGNNYGWRCYEGNHAYNTDGCNPQNTYDAPVFEYQHASGNGCSVSGGVVYRGTKENNLFGKYIFADYCSGRCWTLTPNGSGGFVSAVVLNGTAYQYSVFGEDRYGEVYVAGIGNGIIYKVDDSGCNPVAYIDAPASISYCSGSSTTLNALYGTGLTYQWQKDAVMIDGAISSSLEVTEPGVYNVVVGNGPGCSSSSTAIVVTEIPTPTPIISGNNTVCAGEPIVYEVPLVANATYEWTITGGVITAGQGTNVVTVIWDNNNLGTLDVLQTNN